ncbi:uncharacterized protein [Venturia canescens]|uniref:uncharacterized protein isoform X2 n=2 Tax=Venturia canescens TaxID=32260 RepID=UPI001C9D1DF9|nr:uncharacterized protein LOC122410969 isoform X2 [Venturia canescens]
MLLGYWRNWCEDLEDLLQCPICMERPKNVIYQCIQGHHVCQICMPSLPRCPTCSQSWSMSRNRFAEHLCTKLDEIKMSLIDPENEINKLLIPEKVSVASQTDEMETPIKKIQRGTGHQGKIYPCLIGTCKIQKQYEAMLKHLIIDHRDQHSELNSGRGVFEHHWNFHCAPDMIFDRSFLVADMGTFFLKLSTDIFGNFTGYLLMLHNGAIAKQFTYEIEVSCCAEHASSVYTSELCTCRVPLSVMREKSLHISRKELLKMLDHKDELTCTIMIGKPPDTEVQAE